MGRLGRGMDGSPLWARGALWVAQGLRWEAVAKMTLVMAVARTFSFSFAWAMRNRRRGYALQW